MVLERQSGEMIWTGERAKMRKMWSWSGGRIGIPLGLWKRIVMESVLKSS